jgi:hypothetical protein
MARVFCDFRLLLLVAAVVFIYIQVLSLSLTLIVYVIYYFNMSFTLVQMRLFATQSQYADRLAIAVIQLHHFFQIN